MRTDNRWIDPMPPGGLAERVYCGLRARFGAWPSDFLAIIAKLYRNQIPQRFEVLAARLERERPWELHDVRGCSITFVRADGSRSSTYYLPGDE